MTEDQLEQLWLSQVPRGIKHYNLDAIISVGYRVSSRQHTGGTAPL